MWNLLFIPYINLLWKLWWNKKQYYKKIFWRNLPKIGTSWCLRRRRMTSRRDPTGPRVRGSCSAGGRSPGRPAGPGSAASRPNLGWASPRPRPRPTRLLCESAGKKHEWKWRSCGDLKNDQVIVTICSWNMCNEKEGLKMVCSHNWG
jgi:hypothetical protein